MREPVPGVIGELGRALPRLTAGLLILLAFWAAGVALARLVVRLGSHAEADQQDLLNLLGRTTKLAAILLGALTGLGTMGVNISALVAGLGLTGFALSFALKDALSNLLAGVLILLYRPFRRHDSILVAGFEGTVTSIDLRYTTLRGAEDTTILIPNSMLFTTSITVAPDKRPTGSGVESH